MDIDQKIQKEILPNLPEGILPYCLEIAKRLFDGKASVLVGAGFSINAIKKDTSNVDFPNWKRLGDIFYEKIYQKKPSENENYLNPLKLAETVEAMFGRPTLDQLLIESIPDESFNPSNLHQQLLELPWNKIYTTNYDTLLERTAGKINNCEYSVIRESTDFFNSKSRKIIKLHGSFPSHKPFIITEEDYRGYPLKSAPFVNAIQQTLLEDTVCLIGFYGDDPNFLEWNGWLIDNLVKNAQKVYLVGLLGFSDSQNKLYAKRNIIPIDLSNCEGVNGEHGKALDLFFKFLSYYKKDEIPDKTFDWPDSNLYFHYSQDKKTGHQISDILENWRSIRLKYPHWIIVPEDIRDLLNTYTEGSLSFTYHLKEIESSMDLQFLYEFNWRTEKGLIPINNDLIASYEHVIRKYNPFPLLINIENAITPNTDNSNLIDWNDLTSKWLEIQLSMMRFYREEDFISEWELISQRLNKLLEQFTPELLARYHYERCLFGLFSLDIAKVREELESWPVCNILPFWEAKRAGILAEMGDVIIAEKILEDALKLVQKHSDPGIYNNYSNASQEAYIMQLLKYVKSAANLTQGIYSIPPEITKSYSKRWRTLVQYKCDPWGELKLFEIHLDKELIKFKKVEKKYEFDIDLISTTHNFGGDKFVEKAYSYLRFIEEISIPYHLPGITFGKEAAQGALKCISDKSHHWAIVSFIRMGESNLADFVFDRKTIFTMDLEKIDNLIIKYISILDASAFEIKNSDSYRNPNFANSLATVIPEILSRLCVKCSFEVKMELLKFIKKVFNINFGDKYKGIGNLTKRLINSFSENNQYKILPLLLEFPILSEVNRKIEEEYIDPFEFIKIDKEILDKVQKVNIDERIISELFVSAEKSSGERQIALTRLIELWKLNCLSNQQIERLAIVLWAKIDENTGFPLGTNYYNFTFCNFPFPANVNPPQLLREYINKSDFPNQTGREKAITLYNGKIKLFRELIGTSKVNYAWNKDDLKIIIRKTVDWWDAGKKYLKDKEISGTLGSLSAEYQARFQNLPDFFTKIFSPNYHLIENSEKEDLKRLLYELDEFGILCTEAKVSIFHLLFKINCDIKDNIYKDLFSKSPQKINDAIKGTIKLLELKAEDSLSIIEVISELVRSRSEINLFSFIDLITLAIKKYPKTISDTILSNIEIGMINLISETEIKLEDSIEIVNNKISYKIRAARLSVALNSFFYSKEMKIPEYITNWKTLCLNKNEFSEVRKIWEDA